MNLPEAIPSSRLQNRLELLALALLGCAGLLSLVLGVRHAMTYASHDLQWMGARLLAEHTDPWGERLAGYPHHVQHFSPPNYLHLLYLLLLPLQFLSFRAAEIVWCAVSIGFSIASVALLQRLFALSRYGTLFTLFLLWMSSPMRVVLEVGQMSLFELFFFCLVFVTVRPWLAGAAFGISLVKYSFSPATSVLLLLREHFTILLIAAAVTGLGLLGVSLLLPTPLMRLAGEPFLVSRVAVSPGVADIMTLAEFGLRGPFGREHARTAAYALGLICSAGYALLLSRYRLSRRAELTLLSLASLFFLKHLIYDYVFLVVPLAYALTLKNDRARIPVFAGVFLFWALAGLLNRAASDRAVHLGGLACNVLLMGVFVTYTTVIVLKEEQAVANGVS